LPELNQKKEKGNHQEVKDCLRHEIGSVSAIGAKQCSDGGQRAKPHIAFSHVLSQEIDNQAAGNYEARTDSPCTIVEVFTAKFGCAVHKLK
jgi:hypothetical protein